MTITSQQNKDSAAALRLLEQAYEILNKEKAGVGDDTQILQMLEKIIQLRNSKDDVQQVFDGVWEISAAMIDGDFSKRINLPPSFMNESNIFNFIATSWNTTNAELSHRMMSKELSNDIIAQLSASTLVLVTDTNGYITFLNKKAEQVFQLTTAKTIGQPIQALLQITVNTAEPVKNLPVKLPGNKQGLLSASLFNSQSRQVQLIIYTIQEKLTETEELPRPLKKTDELENLVKEYRSLSAFWIEQNTLLSTEEVLTIDSFLKHDTHKPLAKVLNKSEKMIRKTYNEALQKLTTTLYNYDNWMLNKAKELKMQDKDGLFEKYPVLPISEISQPEQQESINEVLKQYDTHWKTWISQSALLSEKEELSIDYFLNYRSHQVLAQKLGIPKSTVTTSFNNAIQKLRFSLQRYHTWIMARAWEINRQATFANGIAEVFLNTPLKKLNLSIKIINALEILGIKTPAELSQQLSISSLYRMRGMGENSIKAIVKLFKQHQCQHLLKQE